MIEAKSTHNGQYKPYGDYFKEWDVTTDLPKDEVVQWCLENLARHVFVETWRDGKHCYGTVVDE